MADATLVAQPRNDIGKGHAGRVRRDGLVPAVVYGLGTDTLSVSVPSRELVHILAGAAGANTLITLKVDGTDHLALARQIQKHPVKGTVLHVDFIRVRADQEIQADVPVHLIGEAEGVKNGGVLEQSLFTISIEARPADIPNTLEVDISALGIGDAVHVSDLVVPRGVNLNHEPEEMVAQVAAPRVAEEETPAEGEAVEGEGAAEGAAGAAPAAEGESSGEG
ncbi:MAG TPA: 50S ribosomal protein L25/general stress protein Ctc [Acidimicrobiia bacterium]|jgi:large subunit ribosomal protein L25|nr:50S ribosomal protein L25/general stress protein Ctc [Acidimicrobiia bacterium]